MPDSTEFTSEHLAALTEAIASGVTSVTHNGKTVNYKSLQELRSLRAEMQEALGVVTKRRRRSVSLASFRRGN